MNDDHTEFRYERALYLDPGNVHTGVAVFERDGFDNTWDCVDAATLRLDDDAKVHEFLDWLTARLSKCEIDIIGYEIYRLFNDKAKEQTGSEFEAVQIIGNVKYLAHRYRSYNRGFRQDLELVRFRPEDKKPTAGILKSRGITSEAKRRKTYGDHAQDAELQGYRDILKNRGLQVRRSGHESRFLEGVRHL